MKRTQRGRHAIFARTSTWQHRYAWVLMPLRDRKGRKIKLRFMDPSRCVGAYEGLGEDGKPQ